MSAPLPFVLSGRLQTALVLQMCADPREAGEHPCGPAVSVSGGGEGHESGAHSGDESVRQPRSGERGA